MTSRSAALARSIAAAALLAGCGGGESGTAWLALPESSASQVIESEGIGGGQLVIAMDPSATPEEALALGEQILGQAPADLVVNARIYNDEATARNWRTVGSQWTLEHLLVVARRTADGEEEVRWVGPEETEDAPTDFSGERPDSVPSAADTTPAAPDSVSPP